MRLPPLLVALAFAACSDPSTGAPAPVASPPPAETAAPAARATATEPTPAASPAQTATAEPAPDAPAITFHTPTSDVRVALELAVDSATRARGLMFRKSLGPQDGMLFIFPSVEEHPFWMKNTYLSLDMIFLDENETVVGVLAKVEPLNEDHRTIDLPSKYVLEVNAGFAASYGIARGTRATLAGLPALP